MKSIVTILMQELLENKLLALRYDQDSKIDEVIKRAKDLERERAIEILKFAHTLFTKDAPMEYVIREFEKTYKL